MKANYWIMVLSTLSLGYSCNARQEEIKGSAKVEAIELTGSSSEPAPEAYTPTVRSEDQAVDPTPTNTASEQLILTKKKIIKDGTISVKTNDIQQSKKRMDDLLKKLNAYYEREDLQNNDQTIAYDLKIRVPAANFEKLISGIENGEDEIKSKSIQARDVTEEYVDIATRLTNKRAYLKRYLDLLSKTTTVKDILAIEENIRALQEEIESKEGRLKFLNDQVSYSTLNLNLYEEKAFSYQPQPIDHFWERAKTSLSDGWASVVSFVLWMIAIWPILLLSLLIFMVVRAIKRWNGKASK